MDALILADRQTRSPTAASSLMMVGFGHSHLTALQWAYDGWCPREQEKPDFRVTQLLDPQYADLPEQDRVRQLMAEVNAAVDLSAGSTLLFTCAGGNEHHIFSMVDIPPRFDFMLPERPDLPMRPGVQVLPFDLVKMKLKEVMAPLIGGLTALAPLMPLALHVVASPPPIPSAEFLSGQHNAFRNGVVEHGLMPAPVRLKFFLLQSQILSETCEQLGMVFVRPPADTVDADGYMVENGWHPDGVHGTVWYGDRVLQQLSGLRSGPRSQVPKDSPYKHLPDYAFWRKAVAGVEPSELDPVLSVPFTITSDEKVATLGSCFAQHIARYLGRNGFEQFITEKAHPLLTSDMAAAQQFGVYTARYGNVYKARQLLQLFQRAYGSFEPIDDCWCRADGRLVDPFRPQVNPLGYSSQNELAADRDFHLACVRRAFEELDVLVFTLGLTETWTSKRDGAVFPTCPGVVAGSFDNDSYQFVNFRAVEVLDDLLQFEMLLRSVNPHSRIILTVSPVPLIATAAGKHALVATTYSKAALRVACDEFVTRTSSAAYFPSYEIVTGAYSRGRYFGPDLREVLEPGVDHVMKCFLRHYVPTAPVASSTTVKKPTTSESPYSKIADIVRVICDEEANDFAAQAG